MIAGGTDRARREEMPGSKVTSAPRAPVPARANTGRWAGLSTSCGVRSEPAACGVARGARARARRARHGVRGVRGTASAGCGSACGGSRASGGRRWSTPSVRAPGPFGPTDATDPIAWSTCLSPPPRPPRASTPSAAGAPRLHKSCRERRPQSKGRSWVSGRARRDLRVRGGRGHLSERPGWPSGAPISRGSTVSMIAFGGRRGPHRSGSRCRGRPIERREAGREGCLWPDAASQGRPPDGSGLRA